jgi:isocitrate dehydrogenase kinase/phosphatase
MFYNRVILIGRNNIYTNFLSIVSTNREYLEKAKWRNKLRTQQQTTN